MIARQPARVDCPGNKGRPQATTFGDTVPRTRPARPPPARARSAAVSDYDPPPILRLLRSPLFRGPRRLARPLLHWPPLCRLPGGLATPRNPACGTSRGFAKSWLPKIDGTLIAWRWRPGGTIFSVPLPFWARGRFTEACGPAGTQGALRWPRGLVGWMPLIASPASQRRDDSRYQIGIGT